MSDEEIKAAREDTAIIGKDGHMTEQKWWALAIISIALLTISVVWSVTLTHQISGGRWLETERLKTEQVRLKAETELRTIQELVDAITED